jgi:CheY-like chemotaxis protein
MSDTSLSPSAWRGFALGLSIAQEICALLGHTLSVSSEPGRGTAAWLEVGLAARSATTESSAEVAAPAPESEAMIALVEDDPDVYFATSELLIGWGYQVFGGASAEAAIEDCMANAGGRCPDLLLSDFKLPNAQTAIDVIMGFNRHFDSKIPTIVVSGDPSAALDVAVEGLEFEILQKPIRAEKMRALVRYALENSS